MERDKQKQIWHQYQVNGPAMDMTGISPIPTLLIKKSDDSAENWHNLGQKSNWWGTSHKIRKGGV